MSYDYNVYKKMYMSVVSLIDFLHYLELKEVWDGELDAKKIPLFLNNMGISDPRNKTE